MSSRPIFTPHSVVTNGDMSGNITSEPTIIQNLSMVSYDISWTGTAPVGVISLQVSNTYKQNAAGKVSVAGNWNTVTLTSPTAVSGATGNGFIDVDAIAGYAVRVVYTRTSGTGIMNITVTGKVA